MKKAVGKERRVGCFATLSPRKFGELNVYSCTVLLMQLRRPTVLRC